MALTKAQEAVYYAAIKADERFSHELRRVYGKKSGEMRYRPNLWTDRGIKAAALHAKRANERWLKIMRSFRTSNPSIFKEGYKPKSESEMGGYIRETQPNGVKISKDRKTITFDNGDVWIWDSRFERWALLTRGIPRSKNPGPRSVHTAKWLLSVSDMPAGRMALLKRVEFSFRTIGNGIVVFDRNKGYSSRTLQQNARKFAAGDNSAVPLVLYTWHPSQKTEVFDLVTRAHNPGRSVHTAKWDDCVKHVKEKGTAADPYAVCTAAMGEMAIRKPHRRTANPLPKVTSVRRIFYAVTATKGHEKLYLKRSGKLSRAASGAARFASVNDAIAHAKAHLKRYPASRAYKFDVGLAY